MSEHILELGLEEFKKKTTSRSGSAFCGLFSSDGRMWTMTSRGCHGQLNGNSSLYSTAEYLYSALLQKTSWEIGASKEDEIIYLDYLANHSPFKDSFVLKDPERILKEQTSVHNVHISSSIMMMGMFGFRLIWEKGYLVYIFSKLVQAGVDRNLAYYMIQCVNRMMNNSKPIYKFEPFFGGHMGFNSGGVGVASLRKFVGGSLSNFTKSTYKETGRYGRIDEMVSSSDHNALSSFIKKSYTSGEAVKVVNNPFMAATSIQNSKASNMEGWEELETLIPNMVSFAPKLLDFIRS